MRVMRGSRQGEEKHRKTRVGERQRACAGVLYIPQADRQTDRQHRAPNTAITAARQKSPRGNDAVIKTPQGWPWSPPLPEPFPVSAVPSLLSLFIVSQRH